MRVFQLIRPRIHAIPGQREDPREMNQPCKLSSGVISWTLVLGARVPALAPKHSHVKLRYLLVSMGGERQRERESERDTSRLNSTVLDAHR